MARKTTKEMHYMVHSKSDVDRVYVALWKGGRGLISCEMYVKAGESNLVWYVRNSNDIDGRSKKDKDLGQ